MPSIEPSHCLQVAVGVLRDRSGRVLIARRPSHVHQGGKWEFPGGKVHPGEGVMQALQRELQEELGIQVDRAAPLLRVRHSYPEKKVELDIWQVTEFSGEARGCEGQPIQWVPVDDLPEFEFPEANLPIIRTLGLPSVYAISNVQHVGQAEFLRRLEERARAGLRLVQLREPEMDESSYIALAKEALARCRNYKVRLLVNAEPALVEACGADGVHFNTRRLMALTRRPLPPHKLVAASCHNEQELKQAQAIHADFAVLSPVLPTPSHPGAPTLGWDNFQRLCHRADLPVYALGGMNTGHMGTAQEAGAVGVAMLSSFWEGEG